MNKVAFPDAQTWDKIQTLFDQVVDLSPEAQHIFIEQLQVSDEVREWLQRLLEGDQRENGLIDQPIENIAGALLEQPVVEPDAETKNWLGRKFGAYRTVGELGRGGMSIVMLAERADGLFEKQVALKLIKPGPYTTISSERLNEETRILARLQHPNIAHLLDAGISDDGMPYTAMEHCPGEPLNRYCDTNALSINERLRLLQKICTAVHYAHRNLVVHRDLKPSNILVQADGTPKLVDFGIAGILDKSTDQSMWATLLTPEYAAPEQFNNDAVSTASDVYALGTLLYELLTGQRPFQQGADGLPALQQSKLSNDYLRPSIAVQNTASDEMLGKHGFNSVRAWTNALRGDLEAIVTRALSGDISQRYPSAQAMADDIERYLTHYPIEARAAGRGYQFKRWLRRNRFAAAAIAAVMGSLVIGLGVALWQADVAKANATRAKVSQDFLVDIFEAANPLQNQRQPLTANELMDQGVRKINTALVDQPLIKSDILNLLGDIQRYLGNFEQSMQLHQQSLELLQAADVPDEQLVKAYRGMYLTHAEVGEYDQAQVLAQRMTELAPIEKKVNEFSVQARFSYAGSLVYDNEYEAAEAYMAETLSYRDEIDRLEGGTELLGVQLIRYGRVLVYQNKLDEALAAAKESQALLLSDDKSEPSDLAVAINLEAQIYKNQGETEKALGLDLQALEIYENSYSPGHPRIFSQRSDLSTVLSQLGRHREALGYLYDNLPHYVNVYGEQGLNTAVLQGNIALSEFGLRNFPQAVEYYQRAIDAQVASGREREFRIGLHRAGLADSLAEMGDHQAAREQYLASIDVLEESLGEEHRLTLWIKAYLAYHHYQTNEFDDGRQLIEQVGPALLEQFGEGTRQDGYVNMLMGLFAMQSGATQQGLTLLDKAKQTLAQSPGAEDRYASQLEVVAEVLSGFKG